MRWTFFFIICIHVLHLAGQPAPMAGMEYVYVDKVSVEGNKKTRRSIILRELHFSEGDTISVSDLAVVLERSEQMVLNTGLFNEASIIFKNWEGSTNKVHIHVKVVETWYLYPVPIFELADRNFNVWWVEQNRSLDRINFGLDFTHLNTTGRRDKLQLGLQFGYTRNYRIRYHLPFLNQGQTLGIGGEVSYSRNREVNYATVENKQEFFSDENNFVYDRFRTNLGFSVRPGLRTNHLFVLEYQQNKLDERVASEYNPDFFLEGRTSQRFLSLRYHYRFENRDVRFYPWKGSYFAFDLEKDGLGFFADRNALTLFLRYDHYFPFSSRWSLALSGRTKTSLIRTPQPYNDNRAMGFYGNTLHGYEYYVIDGLDMAMVKSSLRFFIWGEDINFGKLMPIKAFRRMPFKFYLSLNNDMGIANAPYDEASNPLNNRLLWGGGLGLDIVLFYDKVIKVEYSVNHLFENGLFLHLSFNI